MIPDLNHPSIFPDAVLRR